MTNIDIPSPNELTGEDKALEDAIGDYLEKETDEQQAAREQTETPGDEIPLDVLDAQVGAAIQASDEAETAEAIKAESLKENLTETSKFGTFERQLIRDLKADHEDVTLPPDKPSPYAQARARRDAQQAQQSQQQQQAQRPAVIDPDREYAKQQQLAAYRRQQANDAVAQVAQQNHEAWLQKALKFPPHAFLQRAAQLEAQAEESYDAGETKQLLREAQSMRWAGEQVLQRHRQVGARIAFQKDAEQVIMNNRDLFDTSKGRGKAMLGLFEQFPELAEVRGGASIALRVVNFFMKQRREEGR